jgi:hypothetical protein
MCNVQQQYRLLRHFEVPSDLSVVVDEFGPF